MKRKTLLSRGLSLSLIAVALGSIATPAAHAQLPIPSAGVVQEQASPTDKPDPSRVYKLAFDIRSMADTADTINPALMGVARLLNTYRKGGVPADHIQAFAVFHGPSIVLVTKDETYHNRTGAKANPNVELLRQLIAAGVKPVVCGVSAHDQNYTTADLLPNVTMNMSATMTFIDLQLKGYVKVER